MSKIISEYDEFEIKRQYTNLGEFVNYRTNPYDADLDDIYGIDPTTSNMKFGESILSETVVRKNQTVVNSSIFNGSIEHTGNSIGFFGTTPTNKQTVNDPVVITAKTLTDNTTGTAGDVIGDVGTSFNQTTLNNIMASLIDEINKLKADVDNLRAKQLEIVNANQAYGLN